MKALILAVLLVAACAPLPPVPSGKREPACAAGRDPCPPAAGHMDDGDGGGGGY